MNQYSTTQLIGELVKRLEAEGPQGEGFVVTSIEPDTEVAAIADEARAIAATMSDCEGFDADKFVKDYTLAKLEWMDEQKHDPECICDHCDDLAGLPTDDAALAFVSAISMGGTGEFMPVQDHELDAHESQPDEEVELNNVKLYTKEFSSGVTSIGMEFSVGVEQYLLERKLRTVDFIDDPEDVKSGIYGELIQLAVKEAVAQ